VGPLPLAEERLGEPVYYRLWCSAEGLPPNEYRSVEFCGWLIGWGASALARPLEAFRLGSRGVATHAEVELFLADDGQIVSAVELLPDAAWEFASSPPDRWATFLGRHADLGQATEWLRRVEQLHGAGARWVAVSDALSQAHETLVSAR
jgi:hypothetical protein